MTIPAPTLSLGQEECLDADFEDDGQALHSALSNEDEDWDLELDLKQTGGQKAVDVMAGITQRKMSTQEKSPQMFTIRPPIDISDFESDDEGVSTIKVSVLPKPKAPLTSSSTIEEDFEDAFSLPSDLTQLSLAPLSLNHRASKNSLEWGDKDHTSSSQSSDAYSTLGFADASPSASSVPDTETEDEDFDELDGIVIPSGLFESRQSTSKLNKLLESKRIHQAAKSHTKVASLDPEDNFEIGLVIDDDVDLSPSRLLYNHTQQSSRLLNHRSNSLPPRPPASIRPPSRLKNERAKSPVNPPVSSTRQFQKLRLSPSPPLRPAPSRSQTFQSFAPNPSPSPSASSFLSPKPGSLRGQKSHSGLKPPTPPSTQRKITRKASLSSLVESNSQASTSSKTLARYEEPTAASRAKSHKNSTSRIYAPEFKVPPTRPSTPSTSTAALRLTMPTTIRHKSRPALSAVFTAHAAGTSNAAPSPTTRSTSPQPPRPRSNLSARNLKTNPKLITPPVAPKVLRRPKRQRLYGDGTELDNIDDLPTDRDKEGRYRVQPKGYGNRVPGGTYAPRSSLDKSSSEKSTSDKGTVRKKSRREVSSSSNEGGTAAFAPSTNTLKRTARIEFPSKVSDPPRRKRPSTSSPSQTRRKPTLIRNLNGAGAPKVVGDMKWNPHALRWEGNDQTLRDFDAAIGTSTRPALITHLTGSSIGSPIGSFATSARIVGTMVFDPTRMCWVSTLPPEEDEPDVFANLADDEEEAWEAKGGTIRASLHLGQPEPTSANSSLSTKPREAPSPARSHTRSMSESGSERGSRASMVYDVDHAFFAACAAAEERHRIEMKGWKSAMVRQTDVFAQPDRTNLYEIRALATRKY